MKIRNLNHETRENGRRRGVAEYGNYWTREQETYDRWDFVGDIIGWRNIGGVRLA